jgi:hypothetical protein
MRFLLGFSALVLEKALYSLLLIPGSEAEARFRTLQVLQETGEKLAGLLSERNPLKEAVENETNKRKQELRALREVDSICNDPCFDNLLQRIWSNS